MGSERFFRILTHPLVVTVFGGFLLWAIQFNVTKLDEQTSQKTAHYEVILKDKISIYYQLQAQSNEALNHLRLLDKLIRYQDSNVKVSFDIKKEIFIQYEQFITATQNLMNLHYTNYMLQSAAAKKGYESFLGQIIYELNPELQNNSLSQTLGVEYTKNISIYDIDVSPNLGKPGFMSSVFESWNSYIEILANELKWNTINLDIKSLKDIDDEAK